MVAISGFWYTDDLSVIHITVWKGGGVPLSGVVTDISVPLLDHNRWGGYRQLPVLDD